MDSFPITGKPSFMAFREEKLLARFCVLLAHTMLMKEVIK